ncbi:hypothetical protein C6502_09585 [Candidatus Poribacteria bacterium]|nr:MAG: hypothetical protein C6502_09585 [Candidatus Poribacteria bacterium]
MKTKFICPLVCLIILLSGCAADEGTTPEEEIELTVAELTPLLNTQAGIDFVASPRDVNQDGSIDLFDLVIVAGSLGDDVQVSVEPGERTIEVINREKTEKTVRVTGTGIVAGDPDLVVLSIGVSVERDSVKQARTEAAEAMAGVIESLKGNGLLDTDIQTQHFSIYQRYDYSKGRREFRGYNVTNTVSAKIRDLDTVGNVIDDAAEAGGDLVEINSIQFTIDDTTKLKMQARVAAMQDAQAKAQTLATEGGVTLGKPISISESGDFYAPYPARLEFAFADDAAAAETPIQSGQLQITVTVNVIYEIE